MTKKLAKTIGPGLWHGDKPPPPPKWRVKDMIPETGVGIMSGRWGTAKTYSAIDLAAALGEGGTFAGRGINERVGVLYLAYEGAHTILRRLGFAAQARHAKLFPFYCAKGGPKLTDPKALEKLIEAANDIDGEMNRRFKVNLGLIIVDTMSTAAGWESENNNAEVQGVMHMLHELSDESGAFILAIDHEGKDGTRGTRGATVKEDNADVVLSMTRSRMKLTKCREAPEGDEFPYTLKVHSAKGGDWTECTVEWGATDKRSAKPVSVFGKLMRSLSTEDIRIDGAAVQAAPRKDVRRAFIESVKNKKSDTRRKAWERVYRAALDNGDIAEHDLDGDVYLYQPPTP